MFSTPSLSISRARFSLSRCIVSGWNGYITPCECHRYPLFIEPHLCMHIAYSSTSNTIIDRSWMDTSYTYSDTPYYMHWWLGKINLWLNIVMLSLGYYTIYNITWIHGYRILRRLILFNSVWIITLLMWKLYSDLSENPVHGNHAYPL